MQGLSRVKYIEIEAMIEKNDIFILTETQLKIDKINTNDKIEKIENKIFNGNQ